MDDRPCRCHDACGYLRLRLVPTLRFEWDRPNRRDGHDRRGFSHDVRTNTDLLDRPLHHESGVCSCTFHLSVQPYRHFSTVACSAHAGDVGSCMDEYSSWVYGVDALAMSFCVHPLWQMDKGEPRLNIS